MSHPTPREVMEKLALVCAATELQVASQTRDFRKALVREQHYKAFVRTVCGLVYTGLAQAIAGDKEAAKALLKEVRDAASA